jgi:hypothetical protein
VGAHGCASTYASVVPLTIAVLVLLGPMGRESRSHDGLVAARRARGRPDVSAAAMAPCAGTVRCGRMEVADDATRLGTPRMQSGAALLGLGFGSDAGLGPTCGQRAVTLGRVPPLACALPRRQPRAARKADRLTVLQRVRVRNVRTISLAHTTRAFDDNSQRRTRALH